MTQEPPEEYKWTDIEVFLEIRFLLVTTQMNRALLVSLLCLASLKGFRGRRKIPSTRSHALMADALEAVRLGARRQSHTQ